MPLRNPEDESQDGDELFDFQRDSADESFGELSSEARQHIRDELEKRDIDQKTLREQYSQIRRAAEEVDVVEVEKKINALSSMSEDSEELQRAKDEIWLDLYILQVKRGTGEDGVVWLQSKFRQAI